MTIDATTPGADALPAPDFIEVYPDALPASFCTQLMQHFTDSGLAQPGEVGAGVHRDLKDSLDLRISGRPEWRDEVVTLNRVLFRCLLDYMRRYAYALIAPLMLEARSPDGGRQRLTFDRLQAMNDDRLAQVLQFVFRPGLINLQRYSGGSGGYPYWHCELSPQDPHAEALHRHLLWTIYLNDDFDEGETEFLYQQRRIVPKTGSLLIAPAAFTHTHRGNRPQGGDKFIATSWVLFQRTERLCEPKPAQAGTPLRP